jgi:hypothetical protein
MKEAVMSGEILLATKHLFAEDPEEVVREFWHQAEAGATLSLILYPEGWASPDRPPKRLVFSRDDSGVSISLSAEGSVKQVSFERAVRMVATAQLLMRRAAGFALAIQRLKQERGFPSEDEAVFACSHWEHGYDWPDKSIPPQERSRIETWANDHLWFYHRGQEVLRAVQDWDFLSKAIQAPPDVSAWILKPPGELGIRWPPAPQQVPDRTNLWEWLAVPPEEILRALAQAAARKKRVALILPGEPVAGLELRADGLLRGFYAEGGSWKTDNWKDNEADVVRFLAEEKAILRRAVVRAAAFRRLVKGRGLKMAAHLLALAEYGFAWLHDVPEAGRFLIQDAADRHLRILEVGTPVLGRWVEISEDPGPRWDPNRADYDLARSIGLEF